MCMLILDFAVPLSMVLDPILQYKFQVPASHLLSASVMSAPAALAMSKLFYPETKTSKSQGDAVYNMQKGSVSSCLNYFFLHIFLSLILFFDSAVLLLYSIFLNNWAQLFKASLA